MLNFSNPAKHKLVVIGDSLSMGFKNGGIYRTDLSFPAMLARCFDPEPTFDLPRFTAQAGIPINMEVLVRGLHEEFGDTFEWNEYMPATKHLISTLRRIKKYWEGGLKDLAIDQTSPFHNQSIWGMCVSDSWIVTAEKSKNHVSTNKTNFTIFDMLPDEAMYTTSRLVLNPTFGKEYAQHSMMDNAHLLQENGGIENLIVCLGHNNIVQAVTNLSLIWSEHESLFKFPSDRTYTISRPEHFELEYRALAERVAKIGAQRVFVPTLPYMTIPPVIRGVNQDLDRTRKGYFDYYTRFWVWDDDFKPEKHSHIEKEDAILLDQTIDHYNAIIRTVAREYGWTVVPMGRRISAVARRRLGGELLKPFSPTFLDALSRNENMRHMVQSRDHVLLSTDYLRLDKETGKFVKGGIFSLDGLHPTTIGYGLMANVYYETMKQAGVEFQKPLDWDTIIAEDTLMTNPPYLLLELRKLMRFLSMGRNESAMNLGKNILSQILDSFSPRD